MGDASSVFALFDKALALNLGFGAMYFGFLRGKISSPCLFLGCLSGIGLEGLFSFDNVVGATSFYR